jgi:hypothetical protein
MKSLADQFSIQKDLPMIPWFGERCVQREVP